MLSSCVYGDGHGRSIRRAGCAAPAELVTQSDEQAALLGFDKGRENAKKVLTVLFRACTPPNDLRVVDRNRRTA